MATPQWRAGGRQGTGGAATLPAAACASRTRACRRSRWRGGARSLAAAFSVSEPQVAVTELTFKKVVFLEPGGDNPLLVTLAPVGDHGAQDMQDHERSSAWRQ